MSCAPSLLHLRQAWCAALHSPKFCLVWVQSNRSYLLLAVLLQLVLKDASILLRLNLLSPLLVGGQGGVACSSSQSGIRLGGAQGAGAGRLQVHSQHGSGQQVWAGVDWAGLARSQIPHLLQSGLQQLQS